jgi:hypothetical protein
VGHAGLQAHGWPDGEGGREGQPFGGRVTLMGMKTAL